MQTLLGTLVAVTRQCSTKSKERLLTATAQLEDSFPVYVMRRLRMRRAKLKSLRQETSNSPQKLSEKNYVGSSVNDKTERKRLCLTVKVYYDADPEDYVFEDTVIPKGMTLAEYMCEIDEDNVRADPGLLADMVTDHYDMSVTVDPALE